MTFTAPRTQIRSAPSERVGAQFGHAEGAIARDALGDDVIKAIDEEQGPIFRVRPWDREAATGGFDNVGD
jgi:hypothetical protein